MATMAVAEVRPPDGSNDLPRPLGPPGPTNKTTTLRRGYSDAAQGLQQRQEPETGESSERRSYAEIIDHLTRTNAPILLQLSLQKIIDRTKPDNKPKNLSELQLSKLITDHLMIPLTNIIELDNQTGRYDTRELSVYHDTNLDNAKTTDPPLQYMNHTIRVTTISSTATRVMFKGVPISVPNEELLWLCEHYGELTDGKVSRQNVKPMSNQGTHAILSSTRTVMVRLHKGKSLKNFYWLAGSDQGDRGRRVTVLHSNQPSQCSWCMKYAPPPQPQPRTQPVLQRRRQR